MNEYVEAEIEKMLDGRDDAKSFLKAYIDYMHCVDDIVDEPKNLDTIRRCSSLAGIVYNCNYWKKFSPVLYVIDRLLHNTYFDAVIWENSTIEWKQQHASVLTHCGYNMVFTVLLLELGENAVSSVSLKLKEETHLSNIVKEEQ